MTQPASIPTEETRLTKIEEEIRPSLRPLEDEAKALEVIDQKSYEQACEIARRAVDARRTITERLAPGKQAAHKAWKEWTILEKELLDTVAGAERVAKMKVGMWEQEQERLRLAEQRRLEEAARKAAEEEKLAAAVAAEEQGADPEEVEAILEEPEPQEAVVAPRTFERNRGVSTRETWKAEVVSLAVLVKHIAANPALLHLVNVNTAALNAMARAQKSRLNIPGVKAVRQTNVAVRR